MIKQLGIGTTRALRIEAPEKGAADEYWWFEIRDPRTQPPTILAMQHRLVPSQGDIQFESWLKANVPETEYLNIPRIWAAIEHIRELIG